MKKKDNYLDRIPELQKKWRRTEDGLVEVTVENRGFYNTIAQKFWGKPRFSRIRLDEYGSFVWQAIDGQRSVFEIGGLLAEAYPAASDQLYERLAAYIEILRRNGYIRVQKPRDRFFITAGRQSI